MSRAALILIVLNATLTAQEEAPPRRSFLIMGVHVIDGLGGERSQKTDVWVQDGKIAGIGETAIPPAGTPVLMHDGKTLIPGLIDTHGHPFTADGVNQFEAYPRLYLAGGVTTVFSPGDADPEGTETLVARIRNGLEPGPTILMGGPYIEGSPSAVPYAPAAATPEESLAIFDRWKGRIAGVKMQMRLTEAQFTAVLSAAHEAGLKVTGHLDSITATRAIELGIDRLEHGIYAMSELAPLSTFAPAAFQKHTKLLAELDLDGEVVKKLIALIVREKVVLSPTCASFEVRLKGWKPLAEDWDRYLAEPVRARMKRIVAGRARRTPPVIAELHRKAFENQLAFIKRVHDKGGIIVTGTDPGGRLVLPGYGVHREMAILVRAGLTPREALLAATSRAAEALGRLASIGTIEKGKAADLVIVDGNPHEDVTAVGRTVIVMKGGVVHDPAALRQGAVGKVR